MSHAALRTTPAAHNEHSQEQLTSTIRKQVKVNNDIDRAWYRISLHLSREVMP